MIAETYSTVGRSLPRVLTTSARKPPLRTDKFAALWRIAAPVHPIRSSNCAESGYCALSDLQTGSITITPEMRSKRHKVRGHRAIAQFSGEDRVVDDRYSASVS